MSNVSGIGDAYYDHLHVAGRINSLALPVAVTAQ